MLIPGACAAHGHIARLRMKAPLSLRAVRLGAVQCPLPALDAPARAAQASLVRGARGLNGLE